MLAVRGTSGTWGAPQPSAQSDDYQAEYQTIERAAAYNHGYQRHVHKRFGTRHEWRLIRRHLDRVGHSRVILELPCGGCRITPAFADAADFVIESDIAIGQLRYGRATSKIKTPRAWMTASAFHIPLRDNSVDGTICIRLAHHLPTAAERDRLFQELLRVSKRFVIVTYLRPLFTQEPYTPYAASVQSKATQADDDDGSRCRARARGRRAARCRASAEPHCLRAPVRPDRQGQRRLMSVARFRANETLIKAEPRTLIWSQPLAGGERVVVKMYRRRSVLDPLQRLVVPYRAEREYRLLAWMRRCGIPCPEPIRWSQGNDRRHGRHDILVTHEIPFSTPLSDLLKRARPRIPDLRSPVSNCTSHARRWRRSRRLLSDEHPGLHASRQIPGLPRDRPGARLPLSKRHHGNSPGNLRRARHAARNRAADPN